MFKQLFSFLILVCAVLNVSAQKLDEAYLKYIEKNKDYALREMERAGIPASIKLAQGLLESDAGRSSWPEKAIIILASNVETTGKEKRFTKKMTNMMTRANLSSPVFGPFGPWRLVILPILNF